MRNLLLIISIVMVVIFSSCNKQSLDSSSAKDGVVVDSIKTEGGISIDHSAPNQLEIDSIKDSKTKGKE